MFTNRVVGVHKLGDLSRCISYSLECGLLLYGDCYCSGSRLDVVCATMVSRDINGATEPTGCEECLIVATEITLMKEITCLKWRDPTDGRLFFACTHTPDIYFFISDTDPRRSACEQWTLTASEQGPVWSSPTQGYFFYENAQPTEFALADDNDSGVSVGEDPWPSTTENELQSHSAAIEPITFLSGAMEPTVTGAIVRESIDTQAGMVDPELDELHVRKVSISEDMMHIAIDRINLLKMLQQLDQQEIQLRLAEAVINKQIHERWNTLNPTSQ